MLFNSFDFFLFIALVLPVQFVTPHRPRNAFLLLASYFFYACWDWRFVGLLLASSSIDWMLANRIAREPTRAGARQWVAASVTVNLFFLGTFKYFNFFVDSASRILAQFGADPLAAHLHVILPVGISFYTFQSISYIVDVYRGDVEPAKSLVDFGLFVAFFPHMVAGPIMHSRDLLPQFARKTKPTSATVRLGIWLVTWGLFKKAVVADNLAPLVDAVFAGNTGHGGVEVLIALYTFAFQIYADFSGYTDIARGVAKLMGYELMLNFRLPYFAANPQEFWWRWHISLSTWLRDYLFVPLGRKRMGEARLQLNIFLTMLLGGLWHGAAWTFVAWGGYQGLLLVGHRWVVRRRNRATVNKRPRTGLDGRHASGAWWTVRVFAMFHLTCFGWLIFRSASLKQFFVLGNAVLTDFRITAGCGEAAWSVVVHCLPLVLIDALQGVTGDTAAVTRLPIAWRVPIYATAILLLLSAGSFGSRAFIYFQF